MTNKNHYWKNKNNSYRRSYGTKGYPKQRFLIVCEGEKTEPQYFNAFRVLSAKIEVTGLGTNTIDLVERTKDIVKDYKKKDQIFDQVWCVFDKDDFPIDNFNKAIELASKYGYKVAYSNESLRYVQILCMTI
jgi:hypothetical protein